MCHAVGILKIAHSPKKLHRDGSFVNTFKETDDSTRLYNKLTCREVGSGLTHLGV